MNKNCIRLNQRSKGPSKYLEINNSIKKKLKTVV